jgi:sugar transferase (PEP-CTERM/EpsH1 system associated)
MENYTDFRHRIQREDVSYHALHKAPGQDLKVYLRLLKVLHTIKPSIIHTRNIGTLECMLPASILRVAGRVHGEHGRDMTDIDGGNKKYILLRKLIRPFVHHYITVSKDLEQWLLDTIGAKRQRVTQIYNGVDTIKFSPSGSGRQKLPVNWECDESQIVIGTVGRLQGEKDQLTLVNAFHKLVQDTENGRKRLRLVIIGDGPLHNQLRETIQEYGLADITWLAGAQEDLPRLYRGLDIFVLPSLGEGISNTLLEAMASGLPVVATHVGGNPELVDDEKSGILIPSASPDHLTSALKRYVKEPGLRNRHGEYGRHKAQSMFSIANMVQQYTKVYDSVLQNRL